MYVCIINIQVHHDVKNERTLAERTTQTTEKDNM